MKVNIDSLCNQGCYYHGQRCWLTKSLRGTEKWESVAKKKAQKTQETTNYLRGRGFNVVEMLECRYHNMLRTNTSMTDFVDSRRPPPFRDR